MRRLVLALGAVAILAGSFFGTLFILDRMGSLNPDSIRAEHAKMIKVALEKYRSARGTYPFPFWDNAVSDLKPLLVDTGYLEAIPEDPAPTGAAKQYRYASPDGKIFGLLFPLKLAAGGKCLTGVGSRGFWSNAPDCPF
jgi:hypothetical protein